MNDWARQEDGKRRHERSMRVITSLAWTTFAFIVGFTISCRPLTETYNRWRDRVAVEEAAEREAAMKAAERRANEAKHPTKEQALEAGRINRLAERDIAWEECIKTQGLDACQAIEERAFQSCWYSDHNIVTTCIRRRLFPEE